MTLTAAPCANASPVTAHPSGHTAAQHAGVGAAAATRAGAVIDVTSPEQFSELLATNPRVITMFTAVWCGPCRLINPEFERLSMEYGTVTFLRIDVDDNEQLALAARISSVPTFISFLDRQEVDHFAGANQPKLQSMVRWLASH